MSQLLYEYHPPRAWAFLFFAGITFVFGLLLTMLRLPTEKVLLYGAGFGLIMVLNTLFDLQSRVRVYNTHLVVQEGLTRKAVLYPAIVGMGFAHRYGVFGNKQRIIPCLVLWGVGNRELAAVPLKLVGYDNLREFIHAVRTYAPEAWLNEDLEDYLMSPGGKPRVTLQIQPLRVVVLVATAVLVTVGYWIVNHR